MISRSQKNEKSSPPSPQREPLRGGVPVNIGFSRANSPSDYKINNQKIESFHSYQEMFQSITLSIFFFFEKAFLNKIIFTGEKTVIVEFCKDRASSKKLN